MEYNEIPKRPRQFISQEVYNNASDKERQLLILNASDIHPHSDDILTRVIKGGVVGYGVGRLVVLLINLWNI